MELKTEDRRAEDAFPDSHAHLTTLTVPTTAMSVIEPASYSQVVPSLSSVYSHDLHPVSQPSHYYSELDWQHGAAVTSSDPSHGPFYSFAERTDLATVQLYHPFPTTAPHTEIYSTSPALWHNSTGLVEDSHVSTLASQRYIPGMSRTAGTSSGSSTSSTTAANGKPKRRRVQSMTQRKAANIRERRRMFHLNTAFDELRKRLPAFNYEKRLSRIETLRLAMTYIGFMKDVTMGEDPRKIKLRPGISSDAGSDLSHMDMESCTSEDAQHEDVDS